MLIDTITHILFNELCYEITTSLNKNYPQGTCVTVNVYFLV